MLTAYAGKLSAIDRWEIVTNKLMKKNQLKDVSWYGGYKVAKIKVIEKERKEEALELLGRWSILIHGI